MDVGFDLFEEVEWVCGFGDKIWVGFCKAVEEVLTEGFEKCGDFCGGFFSKVDDEGNNF